MNQEKTILPTNNDQNAGSDDSLVKRVIMSFPEAGELMATKPLYAFLLESILLHGHSIDSVVVNSVLVNTRRQNDKRSATLEFAVPDELVKNLNGLPQFEDVLAFIRVPREVMEKIKKSKESVIIAP